MELRLVGKNKECQILGCRRVFFFKYKWVIQIVVCKYFDELFDWFRILVLLSSLSKRFFWIPVEKDAYDVKHEADSSDGYEGCQTPENTNGLCYNFRILMYQDET